jgi:hypothetical protein
VAAVHNKFTHKQYKKRKIIQRKENWEERVVTRLCTAAIAALSSNTSHYVTTTAFLTPPVHHKLHNPQRSDQHSVHNINPDIYLLCELHVTVKIYRAARSLSDAESNFFQFRKIRIRAVCLMSVLLHNSIEVRMLGYRRENEVGNLREFTLNLIPNSV